jgi:hypothetical protein
MLGNWTNVRQFIEAEVTNVSCDVTFDAHYGRDQNYAGMDRTLPAPE